MGKHRKEKEERRRDSAFYARNNELLRQAEALKALGNKKFIESQRLREESEALIIEGVEKGSKAEKALQRRNLPARIQVIIERSENNSENTDDHIPTDYSIPRKSNGGARATVSKRRRSFDDFD